MPNTKVKVWGIRQAIWGADGTINIYFSNKEARDKYFEKHEYCDKLRCRTLSADMLECNNVYDSYEEYLNQTAQY